MYELKFEVLDMELDLCWYTDIIFYMMGYEGLR